MKDINKIPGFEKTPEEINSIDDVIEIHYITGIRQSMMSTSFFKNAKIIKKLLDDRWELLLTCMELLDNHERQCRKDTAGNCQENVCFDANRSTPFDNKNCDCDIKDAFETVEKITEKSWEELKGE